MSLYYEMEAGFDRPKSETVPELSYFICATPRTGSTLISTILFDLEVGLPAEYFAMEHREKLSKRWCIKTHEDYLENLVSIRTTRGTFGAKLLFDQIPDSFVQNIKAGVFGPESSIRFLYIDRMDVEAQAVSFALANENLSYRSMESETESKPKIPSVQLVEKAERVLTRQKALWAQFFEDNGITPLCMYYEVLSKFPLDCALEFAESIGRRGAGSKAGGVKPRTVRQFKEENKKLLEDYREYKQRR